MRKLQKAYQRKLNQQIRAINKNIANDILWMGRFEFRQKEASFEEFSDGSGGILIVTLRGYDKVTGYYKDFRFELDRSLQCKNVNIILTRDISFSYQDIGRIHSYNESIIIQNSICLFNSKH